MKAWTVWTCRQELGAFQTVKDLGAQSLGKTTLQPVGVYSSQLMKAWSEVLGQSRSLGKLLLERRVLSLEEEHLARPVVVKPSWLLDVFWVDNGGCWLNCVPPPHTWLEKS